jgi:hypothetical protein
MQMFGHQMSVSHGHLERPMTEDRLKRRNVAGGLKEPAGESMSESRSEKFTRFDKAFGASAEWTPDARRQTPDARRRNASQSCVQRPIGSVGPRNPLRYLTVLRSQPTGRAWPGPPPWRTGPLIPAVGEKPRKERETSKQHVQHPAPTVAVLDISGMYDRVRHQAHRVDQEMSLLALDFLACIVSRRTDRGPPFSALFTLWLSMTHAVGLTSRCACSRQAT